jgi:hypothetical protein
MGVQTAAQVYGASDTSVKPERSKASLRPQPVISRQLPAGPNRCPLVVEDQAAA